MTEGVRDVELEEGKVKLAPSAPDEVADEEKEVTAGEDGETVAQEAATVPLPESPTLKAVEGG